MKEDYNALKKFQDTFINTNGRFYILEQRVPVKLQMEYFRYSERIRKDPDKNKLDYEVIQDVLFDPEMDAGQKKHVLSILATSNEIKAYRMLEAYAQAPAPEVMEWAHLALMEARIALEADLSDEKQIFISTGLGGKGEKLRFYALMVANKLLPFKDYQRGIIEKELPYLLSNLNCDIERLTIEEKYIELLFLVPVRDDIKKNLDHVIRECNQYGDFISSVYTVTNVKELSEEEIQDILKKHEKNDQTGH
ncbi:MAG: hypothetical protein IKB63_04780 [Parabacteroides sp.]|nr:hypothetical protein [Parabacteroides sp.]